MALGHSHPILLGGHPLPQEDSPPPTAFGTVSLWKATYQSEVSAHWE